jgi:hypothetical protein
MKMDTVERHAVSGSRRQRDTTRLIEARRRLSRSRGRAWINGREVGGPDPRYSHLSRSHD